MKRLYRCRPQGNSRHAKEDCFVRQIGEDEAQASTENIIIVNKFGSLDCDRAPMGVPKIYGV